MTTIKRFSLLLLVTMLAACTTNLPATTVAEPTSDAAAGTTVELEPSNTAVPTNTPPPIPAEPAPTEETAVAPTDNLTDSCVDNYQEGIDYFPQKTTVTISNGFTIEYFNHYKVVTVNSPFPDAETAVSYLLVQCGTPIPDGFAGITAIEVPINSIVSLSTTYLPYLDHLGVVNRLVAVDDASFASNEAVRARYNAGEIAEVGSGPGINIELLLDIEPDVVMTANSGSPDFDSTPVLTEAGIPAVINSDYLDTAPLGQAEWGKFIAAFFNQEALAEAQFNDVASEYNRLVELAADIEERPTVFTNTPYEGTWYVAGGQSYAAQLLADAGANYLWADNKSTGSLFLDFEAVYEQAADADYWINIGYFGTLEDLLAADERFADFSAFSNDHVYNNDARTNEFGGNDYYESAGANPHLVLADLIKIFHPELLPDHEFVYYRLVE